MITIFAAAEVTPDFKSRAIMGFTGAHYSHVGIMFDDVIYHAVGEGVRKDSKEEFLKTHILPYSFNITDYIDNVSFARGWCEGSLGKDYSESNLMGIVLMPLRKILYFNDDKSEMICSEYCARFLDECTSLDVLEEMDEDFITPPQLVEALLRIFSK